MNSESYNKLRQDQLPWTEKYKPTNIEELFLEKVLKSRIVEFAKNKNIQNLIFDGSSGVGKTISIKCLAKALYGEYATKGILEMNASDGGVKVMHEEIVNFCRNKMSYKKDDEKKYANFKLVIIDDADNMDENKVQPQINSIMETYKETVKFAFTCNTSSNLIEAIQSRCLILKYEKPSIDVICGKLTSICDIEKLKVEYLALKQIAELSRGDIRCAVNLIQLIYNKKIDIKLEYVGELCDLPQQVTIKRLFEAVLKKDVRNAISIIIELKQLGYSGSDITLGMIGTLKSDVCKDILEKDKINMFKHICHASYRISKHTDSPLQLYSCITDMISN